MKPLLAEVQKYLNAAQFNTITIEAAPVWETACHVYDLAFQQELATSSKTTHPARNECNDIQNSRSFKEWVFSNSAIGI